MLNTTARAGFTHAVIRTPRPPASSSQHVRTTCGITWLRGSDQTVQYVCKIAVKMFWHTFHNK
ncbi:hypothetical protein ATANTOWER_004196, partial [Ataeniobius toweri]|nr:hypothetical protein [Ataeniobius toweri]